MMPWRPWHPADYGVPGDVDTLPPVTEFRPGDVYRHTSDELSLYVMQDGGRRYEISALGGAVPHGAYFYLYRRNDALDAASILAGAVPLRPLEALGLRIMERLEALAFAYRSRLYGRVTRAVLDAYPDALDHTLSQAGGWHYGPDGRLL